MPYATYRFNKIIAAETIRFIVTVAIVVYKGLKLVVYRMLTEIAAVLLIHNLPINRASYCKLTCRQCPRPVTISIITKEVISCGEPALQPHMLRSSAVLRNLSLR